MDDRVPPEVRRTATEIDTMEIRGAATIADAAARALRTQATESDAADAEAFRAELRAAARALYETRPTAVSLPNALRYVLRGMSSTTVEGLRQNVVESADEFCARLERAQADLGEIGANRLRDGDTIMTHCHSTDALACVEAAVEQGKHVEAVVKETRPRNQGHITAKRLDELGVPVTLIVDSAARRYLNDVDHVLVGADAVAADGSVVNKIGTAGLAASARDRSVNFVVAAQTLKFDPETLSGGRVDIEHRAPSEVLSDEQRRGFDSVEIANPAFDRTPARHVDAVVTERGQFPPESIVTLMRELYGPEPGRPWEE